MSAETETCGIGSFEVSSVKESFAKVWADVRKAKTSHCQHLEIDRESHRARAVTFRRASRDNPVEWKLENRDADSFPPSLHSPAGVPDGQITAGGPMGQPPRAQGQVGRKKGRCGVGGGRRKESTKRSNSIISYNKRLMPFTWIPRI